MNSRIEIASCFKVNGLDYENKSAQPIYAGGKYTKYIYIP